MLARVAMSISLILSAYLAIVLVLMPVVTIGKVIAAIAAVLTGILSWICHHERLYTASAATIVGTTIVGGFVASLSNGGADGFVAPVMISAPVIAAVFIGGRAALVSALFVIAAFVSLLFFERMGFVTEAPYTAQTLNIASVVMLAAATGICASGVGYFAHAVQIQIRTLRTSQGKLLEASEQLDYSAHHDSLTGLANRKGLHRYLELVLGEIPGANTQLFLAHVDLDWFKSINDTYGHPVGDAVLKNVATTMRNASFDGSLVARVGGDEFVIVSVVPATLSASEAQNHCERLVALLKAPMVAEGVRCRVGASIGYVLSNGHDHTIGSLMTDADLALYDAKRDGRGRACAFDATMRSQLEQDRVFRIELDEALNEDRVICMVQPQACLRTGRLVGVEGLGRIRSRSGDLLMPNVVVPILTEMGRLADFDFQVICQSLDALVALRREGADIPYVSVNASAQSLRSVDFVLRIQSALEVRGLGTNEVVVEILESTLIDSSDDAAVSSITRLREAGIKTIMDDFGSGHATISNLLKLNLDGLKIDTSLVADLENPRTFQVVRAVHTLAMDLDLSVVMEGVETPKQFSILRQLGCETVQGFGICKPMEREAFAEWIRDYGGSRVSELQSRLQSLN